MVEHSAAPLAVSAWSLLRVIDDDSSVQRFAVSARRHHWFSAQRAHFASAVELGKVALAATELRRDASYPDASFSLSIVLMKEPPPGDKALPDFAGGLLSYPGRN